MDKTLDLAVKFIDNTHSGSNSDLFNLASISAESAPTFDFFGVIICFFLIALLLAGSVLFYKYFNSVKNKSYVSSAKHVNPTFRYSKNQGFNKFQKCLIIGIFAIATVLLVTGCFKFGSTAFADPSTNTITNDSIAIDKDTIVATIDEEHNVTFDTFSLSSVSSRDLRIMSVSVNESDYAKEISAFEGSKINIYGFDACLYAGAPDGLPYDTSTMDKLKPGDSSVAFLAIENYDIDKLIQLSEKDALTITFNTSDLYNVDFDVQGHGVAPEKQSVLEGDKVVHPATDPIETGYTFGGWYKESSCDNEWDFDTEEVFEDTTIYAKWTANTYTIKANAEDGSFPDGAVTELQYTYDGDDVPTSGFTNPVKTGYNATGWSSSIGGTVSINVINKGNLVELGCNLDDESVVGNVYVIWSAKTTEVMLDPTDGEPGDVTSVTATYDSDMPALTGGSDLPTRDGYSFYGYFDASTGGNQYYQSDGTSTCIWDKEDSTVTLYAQWVPSVTIITLNANGGTDGSTKQVTGVYGSAMPSIDISCLPTRTGYDFDGFFDAQEGGKKYYNNDGTSANNWDKEGATSTLYAQWKGVVVTTTFIFDTKGDARADIIQTYGSNYILPSNNPYGDSFYFAGWYLSDGTTKIDSDSVVSTTEHHDINATWDMATLNIVPSVSGDDSSNAKFKDLSFELDGPTDFSGFSDSVTGTFAENDGQVEGSVEIIKPKDDNTYNISVNSKDNLLGAKKVITISESNIDDFECSFADSERAIVDIDAVCVEAEESGDLSCGFMDYGSANFVKSKNIKTARFLDDVNIGCVSAMCIAPFGSKYDTTKMQYTNSDDGNYFRFNNKETLLMLDEGSFVDGYTLELNPVISDESCQCIEVGSKTVDTWNTETIESTITNNLNQFCFYNVNGGTQKLDYSPSILSTFSTGDVVELRTDRWMNYITEVNRPTWNYCSSWAPDSVNDNSSSDWARWKRASSKSAYRVFLFNDQLSDVKAYYCFMVCNDLDNPSEQFILQFKLTNGCINSQDNNVDNSLRVNWDYAWFDPDNFDTKYTVTAKLLTQQEGYSYLFRTAEDIPEGWSAGSPSTITKDIVEGMPLVSVIESLGRPLPDKYDDPTIPGLSGEWINDSGSLTVSNNCTLSVGITKENTVVGSTAARNFFTAKSDIWDLQKGHTLTLKYIVDCNPSDTEEWGTYSYETPYLVFCPRRYRNSDRDGYGGSGCNHFDYEDYAPWWNFRSDAYGSYGKYGDDITWLDGPHKLTFSYEGIEYSEFFGTNNRNVKKLLKGELCVLELSFTESNHIIARYNYAGKNREGENKDKPFSVVYDLSLKSGGNDFGALSENNNIYAWFTEEYSSQTFVGEYVLDLAATE